MSILEAAVLGLVQGITEFLPISSDGHLALVYRFFGGPPDLSFTVFLHLSTLLAIVVFFRTDLLRIATALFTRKASESGERRLALLIVVGTFVSGVLALAMKDLVGPASESLPVIGGGFLVTSAALVTAEAASTRRAKRSELVVPAEELTWLKVALIGIAQGLAVLPGVSRSGTTIAGSMIAGLDRESAARFSFLLGVPIMALAAADDAVSLLTGSASLPGVAASVIGFAVAGIAGYAAIWSLLALVKRVSLVWFAAYTGLLGCILIGISVVGGSRGF